MSIPDDKQVTIDYLRNELHQQQEINRQLTALNEKLRNGILEHVHYMRQLMKLTNERNKSVIEKVIEKTMEFCK